jgi:hypothetical protein
MISCEGPDRSSKMTLASTASEVCLPVSDSGRPALHLGLFGFNKLRSKNDARDSDVPTRSSCACMRGQSDEVMGVMGESPCGSVLKDQAHKRTGFPESCVSWQRRVQV